VIGFLGLAAAAVVVLAASQVVIAARRAAATPDYWRRRMNEPVQPDDFRLVALGDSSVQAIGADTPMHGYVGRIAEYVQTKTGRRVYIANVSTGGTTSDVVRDQLPQVDLPSADLVIVADSNDMQQRVPLDEYASQLHRIVNAVPAERTVFSDLPIWPGCRRYQVVLERATDARGIRRADFATVFNRHRRLDIFS
jgi:hypothetical protein